MAFPQNTKLIFTHKGVLIHSLSASFETQGWCFNACQNYMAIMRDIYEAEPKEGEPIIEKINPAEIEVYIDENGVKRKLGL